MSGEHSSGRRFALERLAPVFSGSCQHGPQHCPLSVLHRMGTYTLARGQVQVHGNTGGQGKHTHSQKQTLPDSQAMWGLIERRTNHEQRNVDLTTPSHFAGLLRLCGLLRIIRISTCISGIADTLPSFSPFLFHPAMSGKIRQEEVPESGPCVQDFSKKLPCFSKPRRSWRRG